MQLDHLVSAVRHQLSEEDRRLLRAACTPSREEAYDEAFDRVLERLRGQLETTLPGRAAH